MTPQQFIQKWQHNTLTERAGAHHEANSVECRITCKLTGPSPAGFARWRFPHRVAPRLLRLRHGKGSHETWALDSKHGVTVACTMKSRHTANPVLKQAGINEKI